MSAGHNHFRKVCKHGRVVAQCRCLGPKTDTVVDRCPPECKPSANVFSEGSVTPEEIRRECRKACDALSVDMLLLIVEEVGAERLAERLEQVKRKMAERLAAERIEPMSRKGVEGGKR